MMSRLMLLLATKPIRATAVVALVEMDGRAVFGALRGLVRDGLAERVGPPPPRQRDMRPIRITAAGRAWLKEPRGHACHEPRSAVRRLPTLMVRGIGDRHETCASYAECLDGAATRWSVDAHCPPACASFKPAPRESAVAHTSSGASSYDAAIYASWSDVAPAAPKRARKRVQNARAA